MSAILNLPSVGRQALLAGVVLGALGWNISASAAIVETSEIYNYIAWDASGSYGGFANQFGRTIGGAGNYAHSFVGRSPTQVSALSYDVTTRLDSNGNFFFLHNAMCIGSCFIDIYTEVKFTLYNNSPNPANFRFDSQITPGHLARQNYNEGFVEGNFYFTLVDGPSTAFQMRGEAAINEFIYPTTNPTYLVTEGDPNFTLNGLRAQNSGGPEVYDGGAAPNWNVLDWGATNLGINLTPIGAYETRNFYYALSTFIRMENPCTDFATCAGLQVAFGDPRNDGSSELSSFRADLSSLAGVPSSYSPVVGAKFDAYKIETALAPQSTPDTRADPAVPPIIYNSIFVPPPGSVPEPASWLMLITGFGLVGGTLRRRQQRLA